VSNVFNSSTSQTGFVASAAAQHFTLNPSRWAIRTQAAVLASWLSLDRISSSPAWNSRAVEEVVEELGC